ncbi:NifB/NifX family molybdenum-iron cluster-binding protein [Arcobacter ellisii]|uniref:Dinitrogenase n=1 Tax=Arcobacter ellisii TaxID=913109 RepID=A0A347U829_9BACT|nr:NifB/NifX family molybdenum-iron cluster-binding protein [Arcobacter ellisii]AXX95007.1 [Fe-Mo] cluster-binding protein, NifX/NifB/NifY family [Arcobacter ellisii]RXI30331.1 dinitrogenase [Arcobacter ellisii]
MIAIPVKTNKENTAVSTLFGKAKYFAFIEINKIEILKNEQMGGKAVANWLKSKNVEVLITSHLGEKPFETLLNKGLKVYFAGDERIELKDVIIKYADGDLTLLTNKNFHTLLKEDNHHSKNCSKTNQKPEDKLQRPLYKSFIRNIHY